MWSISSTRSNDPLLFSKKLINIMSCKKITGIYCIENKINHKRYIGQSVNIYNRWRQHRIELRKGNHDNDYLQKSWNKYGEDSFIFTILEECLKDALDEREQYYIDLYQTLDQDYGYNLKTGGQNGGAKVCEQARRNIRNAVKQSYVDHPELIEIRSQSAYKQWANPEIKKKIIGSNNGMYGKRHTDEAKRKISEAATGRISKRRILIPVLCVEQNKVYSCAAEAAKEIGVSSASPILQCCYGNHKTSYGYHWQFLLENNN